MDQDVDFVTFGLVINCSHTSSGWPAHFPANAGRYNSPRHPMISTPEKHRVERIRSLLRFYRDSLTAILGQTDDQKLHILIQLLLVPISEIEAELRSASNSRRRVDRVSKCLDAIEGRLQAVDDGYKIIIFRFEHRDGGHSI